GIQELLPDSLASFCHSLCSLPLLVCALPLLGDVDGSRHDQRHEEGDNRAPPEDFFSLLPLQRAAQKYLLKRRQLVGFSLLIVLEQVELGPAPETARRSLVQLPQPRSLCGAIVQAALFAALVDPFAQLGKVVQ